ncbi:hypothetical protein DES53_11130 [Roseimicrobium gellanilyticum]|uniref:Uncharacterized protein n=2 Tax=Roseimicrobium gellanilyticum TaxID=748857 RepID=A0A366HAA2_9BACT|nr:hypothetical protein DES53_11130 [Roseimicrobium gellanilyticum]
MLFVVPVVVLASLLQHRAMAQDSSVTEGANATAEATSSRRKIATMEELAQVLDKEKTAVGKTASEVMKELPALPEGVAELRFDEFYKMPVGDRGLEPTEKLLSLNGKRVRILGYMANMQMRGNRQMLLASVPLKAQPLEYGQADDIPAAHVLVRVPGNASERVPFTAGLLLLTGKLTVGGRSLDGENAFVRLLLDPPHENAPAAVAPTPAPTSAPAASQSPQ